jgi:hypothetical protein
MVRTHDDGLHPRRSVWQGNFAGDKIAGAMKAKKPRRRGPRRDGLVLAEKIRLTIENDPITIRDRETLRRKFGKQEEW